MSPITQKKEKEQLDVQNLWIYYLFRIHEQKYVYHISIHKYFTFSLRFHVLL